MPAKQRFKTKYPGVYYIQSTATGSGRPERVYYIMYRRNGKLVEEKAGRQFQDDMTPARAAQIRTQRIEGQPSNKARREATKAQQEAERNRWTFERLWEEYKARNPNLKGTVTDENRFHNYIKPRFGDKEPKDLSPFDVDRLRVSLLKTKAPGTVKNVLELLRRIVNFGFKKHLCEGLRFTIEMPTVNNLRTEDLSPEQLTKLLEAIEKDSNIQAASLMKMALFTGLRRGELFKLKWEDINFHRGLIFIRDPKGGPDQKIPLNDGARQVLKNHLRTDSPFVFPGRDGRRRTDIKHQVNRIKEAAGLPKDFRALHGLRHAYASMLASSGKVDLYTLQKLLTHKSASMTARYAHLADQALSRAASVADELITQAMNGKEETEKEKAQVANLEAHKK